MSEATCPRCSHEEHPPGQCATLHVYDRGPLSPPGNQRCLCGINIEIHPDGNVKVTKLDDEGNIRDLAKEAAEKIQTVGWSKCRCKGCKRMVERWAKIIRETYDE